MCDKKKKNCANTLKNNGWYVNEWVVKGIRKKKKKVNCMNCSCIVQSIKMESVINLKWSEKTGFHEILSW